MKKNSQPSDAFTLSKTAPEKPDIEKEETEELPKIGFPIVGIGASAGGLEAFTSLLQHLPPDTGMAFVLVQHLSPSHKSLLTSLLEKKTAMPVTEVTDGLAVEPNHVYVIPPNTCMCISDGKLHLQSRSDFHNKAPNLPIDFFLTSLAEHQKSAAIGVILSGTASDGSRGVQAIKSQGGITFAQDEKTAQFGMMPQNAAATGCIDFVLSPEKIAQELVHLSKHPYLRGGTKAEELIPEEEHFSEILSLLHKASKIDFKNYKPNSLKRRILRRMMLNKIETLKAYIPYLVQHPKELQLLSQDTFISVTRFFRDPEIFDALKLDVFPQLLQSHGTEPIRIWVLGCSTGEEVYSIAISFLEFLEGKSNYRIQFFATDIKESSIESARKGIYAETIAADVSEERLQKFFIKVDKGHQIIKSIRDLCVFARQNVTADPPFSKIDLISCRNLLIYLDAASQKRVLPIFHYALKPTGFLLLGQSENVLFPELFNAVNRKAKIYSKNAAQKTPPLTLGRGPLSSLLSEPNKPLPPGIVSGVSDIQREADRVILKKHPHAGVVVDEEMKVVQFRGDTSQYLRHLPGTASLDLFKMIREDLLPILNNAIRKAKEEQVSFKMQAVPIKNQGRPRNVSIEITPFKVPSKKERFFLILFGELSLSPSPNVKTKKGSKKNEMPQDRDMEFESTKQYLEGIIDAREASNEALQTANEEILSTNEELQSLNEEFQSANEELESAKEELQATNEEIMTLNDELQNRNTQLALLSDDHINLMQSTNLPVIMVGRDLKIRRFTSHAEKILRLIPSDVGRLITDLKSDIDLPELDAMLIQVMDSAKMKEQEVFDKKGRWQKIQIRPYRTSDNKIDGAVVTLFDITDLKQKQEMLQVYAAYREAIVQTIRDPLLVLDSKLHVKFANRSFYKNFPMAPENTIRRYIYDLGTGEWNNPEVRVLLEEILPKHTVIEDYPVQHCCPGVGLRDLLLNARKIRGEEDELILLSIQDVTERKRNADALLKANQELEQFASVASHDLQEPLHLISNYIDLLKIRSEDKLDEESKQFLGFIKISSMKAQELIRDLLSYAKTSAEERKVELCDFEALLKTVLYELQLSVEESNAEITHQPLPQLMADRSQMEQLFKNLLTNAIKYRAAQPLKIHISAQKENNQWFFSVQDNGIGIAPEYKERVFEMFKRLHSQSQYPGTGVGLAICKKIVEHHGGQIGVDSTLGRGARFYFAFPILDPVQ